VLALSVAACSHAPAQLADAVSVRVAAVRVAPFQAQAELAGNVEAARSVAIGSVVAGRIDSVDVRAGDRVRAGDTIAQVDAAAYAALYEQQRSGSDAAAANASVASAQLDAARARMRLAEVTAARMRGLYVQGAISSQDEDQAQSDAFAARAALDQAQAGVRAARGTLAAAGSGAQAAGVALGEATIRAPFDGVITSRAVEPGAVVGPGSTVATLQDESDFEMIVAMSNASAAGLSAGTPLVVSVDELGDARVAGRIRAVVPEANPALRSVLLKISIAPHPGLIAGMYARVTLPGTRREELAIPTSALVTRAGQSGVFVARDGRAEFVPVEPGAIEHGLVAVRGTLRPGDVVVESGLERVTEGASLAIDRP